MWRNNRNPAAGVDVNRNYDFLWDFKKAFSSSPEKLLQVSDDPISDVYHGAASESEPETRNVVWLLDTYPQIRWSVDIQSYSQVIGHNWGNDRNQITDRSMNFLNPVYNGTRNTPGDAYREYFRPDDLAAAGELTIRMRDALQAVRGITYSTGSTYDTIYATCGTLGNYPYSRHFADARKSKTMGFLIEWGTQFQIRWCAFG